MSVVLLFFLVNSNRTETEQDKHCDKDASTNDNNNNNQTSKITILNTITARKSPLHQVKHCEREREVGKKGERE